ncbi:uncharacterized protein BDZ99DRAFT_518087 [Mytilinidion resinicola]|uniref:Mei2-like C-terminal RNA recognition motif domain-containing protein n=1 Tax=Mytilinidion resinicola TaxID=574789 RepID=A0A6A6YTX3_9PEZI|nr:uncharacterized protein BDZ99DRAFT_518087 [Mytilinidion resinicola]KAF2812231.1 hypothetical protein BDZ99DRAFT_518087 [Mytilinidion resinicola]
MLRNIPNKMTDMQLLKILRYRRLFRGLIDLVFLRMYFGSSANAGHAIFNLTPPTHIIKFLEHFEGRPGPTFACGLAIRRAGVPIRPHPDDGNHEDGVRCCWYCFQEWVWVDILAATTT